MPAVLFWLLQETAAFQLSSSIGLAMLKVDKIGSRRRISSISIR